MRNALFRKRKYGFQNEKNTHDNIWEIQYLNIWEIDQGWGKAPRRVVACSPAIPLTAVTNVCHLDCGVQHHLCAQQWATASRVLVAIIAHRLCTVICAPVQNISRIYIVGMDVAAVQGPIGSLLCHTQGVSYKSCTSSRCWAVAVCNSQFVLFVSHTVCNKVYIAPPAAQ